MPRLPLWIHQLVILLACVLCASIVEARQNADLYVAPFLPQVPVFDGTPMVSLPAMTELLDATVAHDFAAKQYTITNGKHSFTCTPGLTRAIDGGKALVLPLAPVEADELYIPLIPLVAAMGGTVTLEKTTAIVNLPNQLLPLELPLLPAQVTPERYFQPPSAAAAQYLTDYYVVNIDGSGLRRLTHNPEMRFDLPAFSPDGALCLYLERCLLTEGMDLMLRPTGMSQVSRLHLPVADADMPASIQSFSFGADGRTIVFKRVTGNPNDAEIMTCTLDGRNIKSIGKGDDPVFSPDGHYLAYVEMRPDVNNRHIVLSNLTTGTPQYLGSGYAYAPSFSPDGKWLRWMCNTAGGGTSVNYTYALVGDHAGTTYMPPNTHELNSEKAAIFCPDGKHILYWQDGPGFWMDTIERTNANKLQIDSIDNPTFTPDGQHLLCLHGGGLCLADAYGGNVQELTPNMAVMNFELLPDGKHIVFRGRNTH